MRLLIFAAIVGLCCAPIPAFAQSVPAAQSYGEFVLAAATVKCLDTTTTPAMLPGTNGYLATQYDTASVFVGFDSTVSATHFVYELRPFSSGDHFAKVLTFQSNALGTKLCFFSTAGTGTNKVHVGGTS